MRIVQSPACWDGKTEKTIFLAGGITNCPDWQKYISERFTKYDGDVEVFNPRQVNPIRKNGDEGNKQIRWENDHLSNSLYKFFWFPKEALCPIALFELGKWATLITLKCKEKGLDPNDFLFVGVHPDYERKFDVEVQMELIIPGYKLSYTIDDTFNRTIKALNLKDKHEIKI